LKIRAAREGLAHQTQMNWVDRFPFGPSIPQDFL
jgi:hypothetical protein